MRTPRTHWSLRKGVRSAVTSFAVMGVVAAVWLIARTGGSSVTDASADRYPTGIVTVVPAPGAQAPRQGLIGVRLEPGWTPTLTVDGVRIPRAQLDAGTEQLGEFFFVAGAGRAIEAMRGGRTCAHLHAEPSIDVEAADIVYAWCFKLW